MNTNKEGYYGSFDKIKDKHFNFIIQERDTGKEEFKRYLESREQESKQS